MVEGQKEPGRISTIEARITHLDAAITRIESMLKNEIADLKQEQIADLRRDLRGAQEEIKVLRDNVSGIYRSMAEWKGGLSALNWVFISGSGLVGGLVVLAVKAIFKI